MQHSLQFRPPKQSCAPRYRPKRVVLFIECRRERQDSSCIPALRQRRFGYVAAVEGVIGYAAGKRYPPRPLLQVIRVRPNPRRNLREHRDARGVEHLSKVRFVSSVRASTAARERGCVERLECAMCPAPACRDGRLRPSCVPRQYGGRRAEREPPSATLHRFMGQRGNKRASPPAKRRLAFEAESRHLETRILRAKLTIGANRRLRLERRKAVVLWRRLAQERLRFLQRIVHERCSFSCCGR